MKYCARYNQKGFTLVEMSIVLAIVGLITVACIKIAIPLIETARRMETTEKMKKIQEALTLYAVQNNRIPCPGVPVLNTANPFANGFGYEKNNGIALPNPASRCGMNTAVDWRGIVPFETLGLSRDTIRDAWGNFFTYAISPAYALPSATAQTSVHAMCRTREWFYMTSNAPTYKSRNAAKAGFCCPGDGVMGSATNIRIRDGAGQEIPYRSRIKNMGSTIQASVNTPYPNTNFDSYVPVNETPAGVVYVIVSHGPNGSATAFDGVTDARNVVPPAATNVCENANADETSELTSRTYRDCPIAEDVATNANDDIVVWQTQDMMFASENQSCAVP